MRLVSVMPGIVDHASGLINWCSLLQDTHQDLTARPLPNGFNMPLFLDNDTNMLTLAELWFGDGRDMTDFAVVTIENGVGMGRWWSTISFIAGPMAWGWSLAIPRFSLMVHCADAVSAAVLRPIWPIMP